MSSDRSKLKEIIRLETVGLAVAACNGIKLDSPTKAGFYFTFTAMHRGKGNAYAVLLDRNRKIISSIKLKKDNKPSKYTVIQEIDKVLVYEKRAKYLLITHNHKDNPLTPSPEDLETTAILEDYYNSRNIKFLGHYITSGMSYLYLSGDKVTYRKYSIQSESPGKSK